MRATFFGTFRFTQPDGALLEVGSPTARSLFAYLLLNRRQPTDRRRLAFLFWPNASESAARRNLRQYVHRIHTALATLDPSGQLLEVGGSSLQFNPRAPLWLDVEAFEYGLRPQASLPELQTALALYTGDFMQDCYDEWCQTESERLRALYLQGLQRAVTQLRQSGQIEAALACAHTWTRAEPLDESAYRHLMTLHALKGERPQAIQHYQTLQQTLQRELGLEPMPETIQLWQSIQKGEMTPLQPEPAPAPIRRPAPPAAPQPGTSPQPLVGREEELSRLEAVFADASQSGLVLISGEAGIGKTRLIQEYLARRAIVPILQSACYELENMTPFQPLQRALESSPMLRAALNVGALPATETARLRLLVPALAESLPGLAGSGAATTLLDENLPESWNLLLVALSRALPGQPLLLVLDDLHWADASTWAWLAAFSRRPARLPLQVIGLCRIEDLPAEQRALLRALEFEKRLTHFPLARLPMAQALTLARQLLPERAADDSFIERLAHDTAGNPFFIIETVRSLRESGMRLQPAGPLPPSIQRVIEARLERLPAPSREALTALSAIGRAFSLAFMQEICQLDSETCVALLEEWLARGLVEETAANYDFRHDQFRQAAYAGLSQARRQLLHGRIAEALQNTLPPADFGTLTYHFSRSDQPIKTLPFLIQAGQQALRLRSYHESRQFGQQAISLLGQMPGPRQSNERIDINLQLAQAYAFTGDLQRAIEILDETSQMAHSLGDEARLGQVFRRSAQFFWLAGRPALAADYARRSLRVAEELQQPELLFAALRMLGRVSIALAAFDDAIAYLTRYIHLHETTLTHLPGDLPIVSGYLGVAYARVGALERALASAQRGVTLAEENLAEGGAASTLTFARMQQAMVFVSLRDWRACLNALALLPEALVEEEITPAIYMALSLRGYARVQSGQGASGLADQQAAIAWAEHRRYRVFDYLPRLFLAESFTLTGQVDLALELTARGLDETQKAGNRWAEAFAQRLLAETLTRQPEPDWRQVENRLISSMQIFRQTRARPDLAWTYLALRRLYDRAGQIAWAVDCHFRATTIFEELGMSEALRLAQGQAGGERRGAVVLRGLTLTGPNREADEK